MQRRPGVALGVVIAVIAGGWWWLRDRAPSRPAAAAATRADAPPDRAPERPGRSGEIGAPARIVIDDDPRGALRLEGQVVDPDDHGVAGATVVLTSNPPRTTLSENDGSFAF